MVGIESLVGKPGLRTVPMLMRRRAATPPPAPAVGALALKSSLALGAFALVAALVTKALVGRGKACRAVVTGGRRATVRDVAFDEGLVAFESFGMLAI